LTFGREGKGKLIRFMKEISAMTMTMGDQFLFLEEGRGYGKLLIWTFHARISSRKRNVSTNLGDDSEDDFPMPLKECDPKRVC
jgi:hypothetical protein